jgi:hypothetical protein
MVKLFTLRRNSDHLGWIVTAGNFLATIILYFFRASPQQPGRDFFAGPNFLYALAAAHHG